jgi:hypothetical protein
MVKSPLLASITLKHGVFSKVLEHDRQYFRIVLYPVDSDAVSASALGTGTAGSGSRALDSSRTNHSSRTGSGTAGSTASARSGLASAGGSIAGARGSVASAGGGSAEGQVMATGQVMAFQLSQVAPVLGQHSQHS